ncbi:MAG: transglycosylase domain-containing protein [Bdellovibrionales bacterium]|nr:transglycosylase domain-containing protein [Bdellovibrionales bacterium]
MKKTVLLFILGGILVLGSITGAAFYWYYSLPDVLALKGCMTTAMFEVSVCPKDARYARLSHISKHLRNAILISEDAGFYGHDGFDMNEIMESLARNWKEGAYKRGGSTISQQLVKNVFLTPDKTIERKLKEAILTRRLEASFTKDEIFEKYLNVVQFGKSLFGVTAASQYYFQKPASDLTPLESAFIALLLPNPVKYSASFHNRRLTEFARGRIVDILAKLRSVDRISEEEYLEAKAQLDQFPWKAEGEAGETGEEPSSDEETSEEEPL